jgi:hypothetical protein
MSESMSMSLSNTLPGTKLLALAALLAAASACGNYSNTDVEFQLALPARDDLAASPPAALVVADSAEYYRTARDGIRDSNNLIDSITTIIDYVRSFPPSERKLNERVWGPFPAEEDPSFELRVRIQRAYLSDGPAFLFSYQIEFHRRADAAAPWFALITGQFAPGPGGARRGSGELHVLLVDARAQGYPVRPWGQVERIDIIHQRLAYPHTVTMDIINVATADVPRGEFQHALNADGSGEVRFVFRPRDNVLVQAIALRTRWLASGAGRGDARVTEGLAALSGNVGIDCWGPDTRATYVRRDFANPKVELGDPASCVFPDP